MKVSGLFKEVERIDSQKKTLEFDKALEERGITFSQFLDLMEKYSSLPYLDRYCMLKNEYEKEV